MNIVYLLKLLYEVDRQLFERTVELECLKLDAGEYYFDDFYETAYEI